MATNNTIITPSEISSEAAIQVRNNLVAGQNVHTGYEQDFKPRKVGDTLTFEKPMRVESFEGAVMGSQDHVEQSDTVVLDRHRHVPIVFNGVELTLEMDQFSKKHVEPGAITLANDVDCSILERAALDITNVYQPTSGENQNMTSNALLKLLDMNAILDSEATPPGMASRLGIFDEFTYARLVGSNQQTFSKDITEDQFLRGIRGSLGGVPLAMSQNIHRHTFGDLAGGTAAVNGAGQTGSVLDVDTLAGGTDLNVGDWFTIAGVFHVNPITKKQSSYLRTFRVTSLFSSGASINIAPAIVASGPYQNVSAAPADDAVINFGGTSGQTVPVQVVMHPHALSLVTCPLELLDTPFAARAEFEGISLAIHKSADITNFENRSRMDVLWGVKASYAEFGCVYFGGNEDWTPVP